MVAAGRHGNDKPLVWLSGEVKTPPFSAAARIEAGVLLRRLQRGEALKMPQSRALPAIGRRCHELRIVDRDHNWRIIHRIDADAIVIADVFDKRTRATPSAAIEHSRDRLRRYDDAVRGTPGR